MLLIVKKEAKMCGQELQESMRVTEEVRCWVPSIVPNPSHQEGMAFATA